MLVIPCRVRDELQIGDSVSIVVLEVADDHVRIGITSPDQFPEYQEQTVYVTESSAERRAEHDRRLVGA